MRNVFLPMVYCSFACSTAEPNQKPADAAPAASKAMLRNLEVFLRTLEAPAASDDATQIALRIWDSTCIMTCASLK